MKSVLSGSKTHSLDDLLGGEGLAAEEFFHQLVVGLGDGFAHGLDQALEAVADVGQIDLDLLAAFILERLLAEQVDVHGGTVVQLGRNNAGADGRAELDLHIFEDLEVVGILEVALGDEDHGSLLVFLCFY